MVGLLKSQVRIFLVLTLITPMNDLRNNKVEEHIGLSSCNLMKYFFFINMVVRVSLRAPRLILYALKLTII
jgi:hypothetical protein